MADGRFGCEADMSGPAAGSTRSLVTLNVDWPQDFGATQQRAAIPTYKCSISYSITSSARATIDCGTVRSSALAALRLMTSWNLVG